MGTTGADVDVEVCDGGFGEPGKEIFDPLRGADEAVFFAVPAGEHDCAERLPAFSKGGAETSYDFVHGSGAAVRVTSTTGNPGISMVSENNDFIFDGSIDDTNDIPHRGRYVVLLVDKIEYESCRGRANVVLDAFISKTTTLPVLVEIRGLWTMAIQGF